MVKNTRDYSLDIVRIFAFILVVSNHFFLNSGFYFEVVEGKRMYALNYLRTFSLSCVPLFIILTGNLMCNKSLNRSYYKGVLRTVCIYLLASFACIIYANIVSPNTYDVKDMVLGILGFKAATYSWYIEMYLGLYLLIPFLNIIYSNLINRKQKQWLILTLLILTALPGVVNVYNFYMKGWWGEPSLSVDYQKIIPAFWTTMYPITYYFIGCYLREYEIKVKKIWNIVLLVLCSVLFSSYCYYRYYGSKIVDVAGAYQEWESLFTVCQTVLIFMLLRKSKWVNNLPMLVRRLIHYLADLTLGAYLVSSIFDSIFHQKLNELVQEVPDKLEFFVIIVPIVIICSLLLSSLINLIYQVIILFMKKISILLNQSLVKE